LGVRRSPDGGLSAEPGDLSAARGACGGVPLAGLAAPGLLGLPPLGVGGVVLPLLLSAAADLRCKNQFFLLRSRIEPHNLPGSAAEKKNCRTEPE
jgi:hypothetical protein